MNRTKNKNMKGGAITQQDFDNYVKTHDLLTYTPKTPPEKELYKEMVKFQHDNWQEATAFKNRPAYKIFMADYKKSYNETIEKFANNVNSVTPSDYLKNVIVRATDVIEHPEDVIYQYDANILGHNDAIIKVMMQQWENERIDSYNNAIKEYGDDADKLWNDTDYKKDEPNPNKGLRDNIGEYVNADGSKIQIDQKYYWNPQIWGFNESLKYMRSVIPRPRKKDWTDYFVEGLTMPFTLASKIPGLNMIPGVKLTSDILGGLQGGQLPVIKGHYLI